jgi:Ca2+-binding RTX toxin-like protein
VNGDGFADFLVGARGASGGGGATYLVFGQKTGFAATLDLSKLNGKTGMKINALGGSGKSVASAGDVNGDGFNDIVIGAPFANSGAGVAHVIFGKKAGFSANFSTASLNGRNGFTVEAEDGNDYAGFSVSSAGDVNGDGFDDILIGARDAGDQYAGRSYVVFGKSAGFPAFIKLANLNGDNGFKIDGANSDQSGVSVSAAGDINRDGFDDLIIGAANSDANGADSGAAHIVFGSGPATSVTRTGTESANIISGGSRGDLLDGRGGNDELVGYGGNDRVNGGTGRDSIRGGDGNDDLGGNSDNDSIAGGQGQDRIWGGSGDDRLSGNQGDDVMNGGLGVDRMAGGLGSDTFVFNGLGASGRGIDRRDIIVDFVAGVDKIDVSAIDADPDTSGNQTFVFIGGSKFGRKEGELRVTQESGNTIISFDVDGDRSADFQIELKGLINLTAADFIL